MGTGNPGGSEPKLVGIGREKVCGKNTEKKTSWLFYLVIFVCFFLGNDLGVEILVTRYVMLFFVG